MTDKPLRYAFDLDGTLCKTKGNDYENAKPIKERIECVNRLYNQGHHIFIFTGRGVTSKKDWRELTMAQVKKWGIKCHKVTFQKPAYDMFVDDKVINAEAFEWK